MVGEATSAIGVSSCTTAASSDSVAESQVGSTRMALPESGPRRRSQVSTVRPTMMRSLGSPPLARLADRPLLHAVRRGQHLVRRDERPAADGEVAVADPLLQRGHEGIRTVRRRRTPDDPRNRPQRRRRGLRRRPQRGRRRDPGHASAHPRRPTPPSVRPAASAAPSPHLFPFTHPKPHRPPDPLADPHHRRRADQRHDPPTTAEPPERMATHCSDMIAALRPWTPFCPRFISFQPNPVTPEGNGFWIPGPIRYSSWCRQGAQRGKPSKRPERARGCGSVGRASPCQGEGREFESRHPLGWKAGRVPCSTPDRAHSHGGVAERRGNGLQSRLHGFKSRHHLARRQGSTAGQR